MDSKGTASRNTNALILTGDLTGHDNVVLKFWNKWSQNSYLRSVGELFPCMPQPNRCNGVLISEDGESWHPVTGYPRSLREMATYSEYIIDLDQVADEAGIQFNSHFKIKFTHYVEEYTPMENLKRNFWIDDISIE